MKKHLLKIILGGLVVFFSLPLIFDGDAQDIASADRSKAAAEQEEQGQEMLPVVPTALPFQSQNVLEKYASRFKKFYVNAKKEKSKIQQDIYQAESGAMFASADTARNSFDNSSRTASNQEEDKAKEYFADVMADNSSKPAQTQQQAAIPYGAAATKQKIHDNAPVKGLYESSAVDSYESRAQAKEVYTNVMSKVDGTAAETQAQRGSIVSLKQAAPIPQTAEDKQAAAKESKYIGIASKNTYGSKGANGKAYGGFGGGGVSAKATGSANAASMGDFESSASAVESKTEEVAQDKIVRHFTTTGGGTAGGATDGQQATAGKPTASNPLVQPQGSANPPSQEGDGGGSSGGTPTQPDNLFDPSKWTVDFEADNTCYLDHIPRPANKEKELKTDNKTTTADIGNKDKKEEEGLFQKEEKTDNNQDKPLPPQWPKWAPDCVEGNITTIKDDIIQKYSPVVIAGKTENGHYVVMGSNSFAAKAMASAAKMPLATPGTPREDGVNVLSPKEIKDLAAGGKTIFISTVAGIPGVKINPGDFEKSTESFNTILNGINEYPDAQAKAIKAAQEAAALKAKQKEDAVKAQQESDKKDLAEAVNKYTKK